MAMSNYPVTYTQSPPEQRSRLTVFFRFLLVIPHAIVACFYGIAAFVAVVVAWFAIVFTGRWPAALYDFAAGFLRFIGRMTAYMYLVVDVYPPFDGGEHPEYPVQLVIAPPKDAVQPPEDVLPGHPRDPGLHRAVRLLDLAVRRRDRALGRRGDHRQDAAGADGGDAHADGLLPACSRTSTSSAL